MSDDTRERSRHAARDASAPPNGSDGNQTMIQPDQHLDAEMLSAWLDTPDDFSEQDRLAIENHLAGCAECSQIAAELLAIVRAFQTLPFVEPERSFALTPEAAGLVATPTLPASRRLEEPSHLHERKLERETRKPVELYEPIPWYERQMRALRWATTVAAMLFVLLISVDVLGNVGGGSDDADAGSGTGCTGPTCCRPRRPSWPAVAMQRFVTASDFPSRIEPGRSGLVTTTWPAIVRRG